jgi:hypothetical protein
MVDGAVQVYASHAELVRDYPRACSGDPPGLLLQSSFFAKKRI